MLYDKIITIIPTLFAIYLILISSFPSIYWKRAVKSHYREKKGFQNKVNEITNVALDWAARLTYISSMLSSLISLLVMYHKTGKGTFSFWALIGLICVFTPTLWWVFSFHPGELVSTRNKTVRLTDDKICSLILLITYLILGIAQLKAI